VKNPWIRYTLIRLALFFGIFLIFALLDFNIYFAAIIAAAISFAISLLVLDRERNSLSEQIHEKLSRTDDGSYVDPESDLENQVLDLIDEGGSIEARRLADEAVAGPDADVSSEGEVDDSEPEAHK
jgi:hypothetical protein